LLQAGADLFKMFLSEERSEGSVLCLFDTVEYFRFHAGFRRPPHSSVDGQTCGDLAEPAGEAAWFFELREFSEGAEEYFLDDFVSFCGIAEPSENSGLNLGLEHSHELAEGSVITALGLAYEISDGGVRWHDGAFASGQLRQERRTTM
jgi:hypothetical protein